MRDPHEAVIHTVTGVHVPSGNHPRRVDDIAPSLLGLEFARDLDVNVEGGDFTVRIAHEAVVSISRVPIVSR